MTKWKVSKHHDPLCDYPWEVGGPDGELRDVFVTWAEALEWVNTEALITNEEAA